MIVKNPTEELTGICTFHFGRGIFRYAQYDVRTPIVGFADTLPEGESEISFTVFASGAKQSPGRVEVCGV